MQTVRRALKPATVVAALSIVTAPSLSAAQAMPVLDKAVAAWAKVKSLSGTFEQTLTNPLLRTTTTSHGEYQQQRPNKLAIRYTDPAGDAIVADGKYIWVYLPQAAPNQVRKLSAADNVDIPIDMSQFLDRATERYDIVGGGMQRVGTRSARLLTLTPRKGRQSLFTNALVWVDDADGLIRQFEVTETSGVVRRIRLTVITVNPAFNASEFSFVVPKGAKVIDP